MSKRKTVKLNLEFIKTRIKEQCRSNVVFSEKMGRPNQKTWVTGWGINKNLPSPEEAARMCAILNVRPEEILVEQTDIELVRGLIESQRGEKQKKDPLPDGRGLTPERIREMLDDMSMADLASLMAECADAMAKKQTP